MAEQSKGRMLLPRNQHRKCCPEPVYDSDATLTEVVWDFGLLKLAVFVAHGFLVGHGGCGCTSGEILCVEPRKMYHTGRTPHDCVFRTNRWSLAWNSSDNDRFDIQAPPHAAIQSAILVSSASTTRPSLQPFSVDLPTAWPSHACTSSMTTPTTRRSRPNKNPHSLTFTIPAVDQPGPWQSRRILENHCQPMGPAKLQARSRPAAKPSQSALEPKACPSQPHQKPTNEGHQKRSKTIDQTLAKTITQKPSRPRATKNEQKRSNKCFPHHGPIAGPLQTTKPLLQGRALAGSQVSASLCISCSRFTRCLCHSVAMCCSCFA